MHPTTHSSSFHLASSHKSALNATKTCLLTWPGWWGSKERRGQPERQGPYGVCMLESRGVDLVPSKPLRPLSGCFSFSLCILEHLLNMYFLYRLRCACAHLTPFSFSRFSVTATVWTVHPKYFRSAWNTCLNVEKPCLSSALAIKLTLRRLFISQHPPSPVLFTCQ